MTTTDQYSEISGTNWNLMTTDGLPEEAKEFAKNRNIFEYGGNVTDVLFQGNDVNNAKDWIVVTDNGGFYKHGAKYMTWTKGPAIASWSKKHVAETIVAIVTGKEVPQDPEYQT